MTGAAAALVAGLGMSLTAAVPAQALSGGSAAAATSWGYIAKLDVGGKRSCTGALVGPQWVVTATSCFSIDGGPVTAGAPPLPTTVTLGRADLTTAEGHVLQAVSILPHPDQDVTLVKLPLRITDLTPLPVSGTSGAVGDPVQVAGYGRTSAVWVPDQLQAVSAAIDTTGASSFTWAAQDATACKGDAGGPVVRVVNGQPELLGLATTSGQGGCLTVAGTVHGGTAVRVDTLKDWLTANTPDLTAGFQSYLSSTAGIGGFDLNMAVDRVVPFDYDHSGKLDHLVLYRPGYKVIYIVKHNADGTFTRVFTSSTGIGGFDLSNTADQVVAFDHEHADSNGYLVLYRPGGRLISIVGRTPAASPTPPTTPVQPAKNADSVVEDFAYPGAADILANQKIELVSGDGHILLADCATPPANNVGVIKVWTTEPLGTNGTGLVCFKVLSPVGRLDLRVPGVYEIRGDGQKAGTGHSLTATITTDTGPSTTVVVNPSGSTQVGIGADPNNAPTTLLQLRVPS